MGLSILLAAILLVLLDRVGPGTSPENALGMIALLTIPVSVGFSIGAALAPQGGGVNSEEMQGGSGDLRVAVTADDRPASGGRPLEVMVENVGGTSAENVIVEVTVGDVTREVDLNLVAKGDTESATVWSRPAASRGGELHQPLTRVSRPGGGARRARDCLNR
jgi:hypothetical protein